MTTRRLVLVLVAVPTLVLLAGVVWVAAAFSGGFDDLFRGDPPREGDPEVVAAREEAEPAADAEADELATLAAPTLTDAERLGRGRTLPPCQEGQHTWKIDDEFDLRCDLSRLEALAVPSREAFREDIAALDARLREAGWTPGNLDMDRVLGEYWDALAGGDYSMQDLPNAEYSRVVDGRTQKLSVSWFEVGSDPDRITFTPERTDLATADGAPADPEQLLADVPVDGYAVLLTTTVRYFDA